MAIFNSYVKLPEGTDLRVCLRQWCFFFSMFFFRLVGKNHHLSCKFSLRRSCGSEAEDGKLWVDNSWLYYQEKDIYIYTHYRDIYIYNYIDIIYTVYIHIDYIYI